MRWVSIAMVVAAVLVPRSASAGDYPPLNCTKQVLPLNMRFAGPMPWANLKLGWLPSTVLRRLSSPWASVEISKTRRECC